MEIILVGIIIVLSVFFIFYVCKINDIFDCMIHMNTRLSDIQWQLMLLNDKDATWDEDD